MYRVSTPRSTRLDHETYWTLHIADRGGEAMILATEASSRIWNTQRKVMNEDSFRTDIRIKNICLPNRWYHYASWKVHPEWMRTQPGAGHRRLGATPIAKQGAGHCKQRRPRQKANKKASCQEGHNMQGFEHKTNSKYHVLARMGHLFCIQTRFSLTMDLLMADAW